MVHILIGILAIVLGIWRMLPDWMFFGEMLRILLFVALVGYGVISILAGLRQLGTRK